MQPFTEAQGRIKSFNFDGQGRQQYGRNLKYSICFKRPSSTCEVYILVFLPDYLNNCSLQIKYTRDSNVPPYAMSVGKIKPEKKYEKCSPGNRENDNGCGAEECIRGGDKEEEKSGDYLLISGGIYTKSDKDKPTEYRRTDYYCGAGVGEDGVDGEDLDGTDKSKGVLSQVTGPVVLR